MSSKIGEKKTTGENTVGLFPGLGKCEERLTVNGERQPVSVVIVPLRIKRESEDIRLVSWSCNMADDCYNSSCVYSHGER